MIIPRREYDRIKEALTKMEIDIFFSSAQLGGYISEVESNGSLDAFLTDPLVFYSGSNDNPTPSYIPDYQK